MRRTLIATALAASMAAAATSHALDLIPLGTFATGAYDKSAAEVLAHDPLTQRLFVINAADSVVDVLDISDPANPKEIFEIDVTANLPLSGGINSVAVHSGRVAVAVENQNKQANGWIALYSTGGGFLGSFEAGALPDMVTFTHNGRYILSANEGEPNVDYSVDPEGTVTIVDLRRGIASATVSQVRFPEVVSDTVRITGKPGTTVRQDLEPEYITTSQDSRTAWVTLQENNAIAKIDIPSATVIDVVGLGYKDHSQAGNGLDASDSDSAINIAQWPVRGLYMPDTIASYTSKGKTYLVTANEGDAREYTGYVDIRRTSHASITLDPTAFPTAATLKNNANLGRLNLVSTEGDMDGDGDKDALYSFGARSISIWDAHGTQIYDSGDIMEQVTAATYPNYFNASNTNNTKDNRSDDKGPEPEGVAIGKVKGRDYAFVGLERIGGIMVFDITDPANASYVSYFNNRDFTQAPSIGGVSNPAAGDLGPEGLIFIKEEDSPNGMPMLVVGNEISGTTTLYQVAADSGRRLQHGSADAR